MPVAAPAQFIDNTTPFVSNLAGSSWNNAVNLHRDLANSSGFWVVYLLASWQGPETSDLDPDSEGDNPGALLGAAIGSLANSGRNKVTFLLSKDIASLSTYLGHKSVAETYWYLEAVPDLMRDIADRAEGLATGERP